MKIVSVNGSPRRNGNTAKLMELVELGAKSAAPDAKIRRFHLNEMDFKGCQGCRHCKTEHAIGCVQNDDLTELLREIVTSDALILGSPIYMGHVSGQFKLFMDRLYGFTGPNRTIRLPSGKRAVIVLTQGVKDVTTYSNVVDLLTHMFSRRGFVSVEAVLAGGCSGAASGDIAFPAEVEAKARKAGVRLTKKV